MKSRKPKMGLVPAEGDLLGRKSVRYPLRLVKQTDGTLDWCDDEPDFLPVARYPRPLTEDELAVSD